jgi:flagellar hook assembly protein FlgD
MGVYDAGGRSVRQLGQMSGGAQTIAWDGRDQRGVPLGAGVYFFKIEAPGFDRTVKVQKIH